MECPSGEEQPSILENGSGLFETHVTLEDVNDVISEQMHTQSRLQPDTKFNVIGDGNGISSRVVLVDPEWTLPDDRLPKQFVLKITSSMHLQGLIEMTERRNFPEPNAEQKSMFNKQFEENSHRIHNQEVNFYKIIQNWDIRSKLLAPVIHFSKAFDSTNRCKGFLGMEYAKGAVVRHLYEITKPEELYPVLKAIATLQAGTFRLSEEEKQQLSGSFIMEMREGMMKNGGMKEMFEQASSIDNKRLAEKIGQMKEHVTEMFDFELEFRLNKRLGIKEDVIVHGDLWTANIMWKEGEGNLTPSKILDYQLVHLGNPAEDIVRLFVSALSGADRQNRWEELLEKFYEYLVEAVEDRESPYTLEQLKESYRLYFVSGGLAVVPMFGHILDMKLKSMNSEKDNDDYKEVVVEKMECLLEDVRQWHQYTKAAEKKD
ncbi:unnamed protein product [Caenorhabditis sp. 36 PRJEB53466]|nr:unnamed protein product [Caenorhabditis sp. 36 PRJEB53466]